MEFGISDLEVYKLVTVEYAKQNQKIRIPSHNNASNSSNSSNHTGFL